ncbi:MAG TPA: type I glyceraldehyde-3-phosphate dehydrogenase [Candidatus Pacearchaeota archaeon]|nr:type I glyceraldehyde-3-phosphate dehydrogenase [Candidatus Pacearchaeota archaeon]HOL90483.1 type I glyceraldehyde-3-phosphate dehydrogenase [Candidatus Pacearchaeota archaeon]HPO68455.1 type I glyceraldehyde-3-phosphate dehydrogenase [Candidatus Pacearchaeota archaeon]
MIKIAINGFGRIGRLVLRKILESNSSVLDVVAINDLSDSKTLAHLLKYDSNYGTLKNEITADEKNIIIDNKKIIVFSEKDPLNILWKDLNIDIVLECTGVFTEYEDAKKHLDSGTKKVIISAPSKSKEIPTFILGVNENEYNPVKDNIISMGSCTTNCLAPIVKIINDNLIIKKGFMTTCHSYTNDQRILDLVHKDIRRARAAGLNIIPTTTGAASTIGKVIKELDKKLDGIALRVPTSTVSILDLIIETEKSTTKEELNKIFKDSENNLKGILRVEDNSLVSSDFKGDSHSAIIDSQLTVANDNLIKVVAWYDNEWGYASRLKEFAEFIGNKI